MCVDILNVIMMEFHFAAFSGPDFENVAVQYMWFLIAGNTAQSLFC